MIESQKHEQAKKIHFDVRANVNFLIKGVLFQTWLANGHQNLHHVSPSTQDFCKCWKRCFAHIKLLVLVLGTTYFTIRQNTLVEVAEAYWIRFRQKLECTSDLKKTFLNCILIALLNCTLRFISSLQFVWDYSKIIFPQQQPEHMSPEERAERIKGAMPCHNYKVNQFIPLFHRSIVMSPFFYPN